MIARPVRPVMKNPHLIGEARRVVARERKLGEFQPEPCAVDGCTRLPTVGHHEDYALPLDVTWLCRAHHTWRHLGDLDEQLNNVWLERDGVAA